MTIRRVFCVQMFRRQGSREELAKVATYGTLEEALIASQRVSRGTSGVMVYEVEVDPETEFCGEPRAISSRRL